MHLKPDESESETEDNRHPIIQNLSVLTRKRMSKRSSSNLSCKLKVHQKEGEAEKEPSPIWTGDEKEK